MQRSFVLPSSVWLLGALACASCSLAVRSELDDKPSNAAQDASAGGTAGTDGQAGSGGQDAFDEGATDDAGDGALSDADASDDAADGQVGDAADASDAPSEAGDCSTCPGECCSGQCVDLEKDPANCGSCDHACTAGRSCKASACEGGWVEMSDAPGGAERAKACAVWAGDRLFVWGGVQLTGNLLLGNGLLYDPRTDDWTEVPASADSPAARAEPVCLWTGSKVFVWGGVDPVAETSFGDGALWDPTTGTWEPLASGGPTGRSRPVALWTGSEALIWGGMNLTDNHGVTSGSAWDSPPATWSPMSTIVAPTKNKELAAAWTGSEMLVFGGRDDGGGNAYNTLYAYAPSSNTWGLLLPTGTAATIRSNAFAGFGNSRLVVWGGFDKTYLLLANGARVKIGALPSWEPVTSTGAPTARARVPFESGWTFVQGTTVYVFGGVASTTSVAMDGASYDLDGDVWAPIAAWSSGQHLYGVGTWTGEEFIVWGGYDGSTPLLGGSRWMP